MVEEVSGIACCSDSLVTGDRAAATALTFVDPEADQNCRNIYQIRRRRWLSGKRHLQMHSNGIVYETFVRHAAGTTTFGLGDDAER